MTWLFLALVVALVPRGRPKTAPPRLAAPAPRPERAIRFDTIGAAAAFVTALIFVPLPWGLVIAVGAAMAAKRFLPSTFSRPDEARRLAVARRLPDAVDLTAALLRAGLTDADALAMVVSATDGPLRAELAHVAGHRRLGAPPNEAWRSAIADPQLADFAAAMARHADTGAPIAAVLDRVAADARRDYFSQAQAAARAAAVKAVIPLAACFLPAFVLVGIVPIVASLLSGLSF
jgi:Flp pilus assembly protein TadB